MDAPNTPTDHARDFWRAVFASEVTRRGLHSHVQYDLATVVQIYLECAALADQVSVARAQWIEERRAQALTQTIARGVPR